MLKLLWSHCRNITVNVFNHKIVYEIPIYNETMNMLFSHTLEKNSSGLRLTIAAPVIKDLESIKGLLK